MMNVVVVIFVTGVICNEPGLAAVSAQLPVNVLLSVQFAAGVASGEPTEGDVLNTPLVFSPLHETVPETVQTFAPSVA